MQSHPSFLPYCYLLGDHAKVREFLDASPSMGLNIVDYGEVDRKEFKKPVKAWQVFTRSTRDVPRIRSYVGPYGLQTRETDTPFPWRYLRDEGIRVLDPAEEAEPRVKLMSLDLETYCPKGFGMTPKKDPIIIASLAWEENGEIVRHVTHQAEQGGEAGILRRVTNLIRGINPDAILSYNGNRFDFPFLNTRSEILEVPMPLGRDGTSIEFGHKDNPSIAGRCLVDLSNVIFRDFDEIKDKRLKYVSDLLGIMRKADRTMIEGRHIAARWDDVAGGGREKLLKYAGDDAVATLLLGKQLLASQYALARTLYCTPQDAANISRGNQVELYFLREAFQRGMLYPNKRVVSPEEAAANKAKGGLVFDPPTGLFGPIDLCDFSAMYPTVIMKHNLSPDSFCEDSICTMRHWVTPEVGFRFHYYEDDPGFMSDSMMRLVTMRKPLKQQLKVLTKGTPDYIRIDAQQDSLKRIANATYGVCNWLAFRYYFPQVTASITAWARYYIRQAAGICSDKYGLKPLYADTDSLFLHRSDNVKIMLDHINEVLPVQMELEDTFSRIFFSGAKKRYAALSVKHKSQEECVKGEPCQRACQKLRGFETRRGDWSLFSRNMQQSIIDAILNSPTTEAGVKASIKLTRSYVSRIKRGQFDIEDVLIKKEVTKDVEEYKQIQPHVEALKRAVDKDQLEDYIGTDIEYVVLQGRSTRMSDRSKVAQLVTEDDLLHIDKEYYIQKQILPTALRILEAFGVTADTLVGQERLF